MTDHTLAELKQKINKSYDDQWNICARDFWYWCQYVETVDEDDGAILKMPLDNDQLIMTMKLMNDNRRIIFLKARRQMLSWLAMLRELHSAMFAGSGIAGTYDAYLGGIMSIGELEAKYLIKRPTKVWRRFPEWMKERNPLVTDNALLMRFEKDGEIQAFPMKREGPQTFGFTSVVFDEMALQEAAHSTWVGMIPTLGEKGRLCAISTPRGKLNFYYRVWSNEDDNFKGLKRVYIHWDGEIQIYEKGKVVEIFKPKRPLHDKKWLDKQTEVIGNKSDIARMYYGSFDHYPGKSVWKEYDEDTHVKLDIEVIPSRPVYIGWDFGYHFPAVTFWQRNTRDQWVGIGEYDDFDIGFDKFCKDVKDYASTLYNRDNTKELHFVDPAGYQRYSSRAESGAASDVGEIKLQWNKPQIRPGAVEVGTRDNEGPRIKEVRTLWGLRGDKQPGIILSKSDMKRFISGCNGGYSYPDKGGEQPDKNEASHLQDSFQYVVTGYNRMAGKKKTEEKQEPIERIGRRTGM